MRASASSNTIPHICHSRQPKVLAVCVASRVRLRSQARPSHPTHTHPHPHSHHTWSAPDSHPSIPDNNDDDDKNNNAGGIGLPPFSDRGEALHRHRNQPGGVALFDIMSCRFFFFPLPFPLRVRRQTASGREWVRSSVVTGL